MAGQRALARQAVMAAIEAEGRAQLARDGAAALSVRSVARELDMASSAIYRYVESKDELLTLLIVAGYHRLADALEAAGTTGPARDRWVARCTALRAWAHANPHEYALLYGSPVPGYAAPQDTVDPATRVYAALAAPLTGSARPWPRLVGPLTRDGEAIAGGLGLKAPAAAGVALLRAWAGLFGLVTLELFGHTHGVVTDHDAMFAHHVEALADDLGLQADG
jgi:AcrR family transcriptional regulator